MLCQVQYFEVIEQFILSSTRQCSLLTIIRTLISTTFWEEFKGSKLILWTGLHMNHINYLWYKLQCNREEVMYTSIAWTVKYIIVDIIVKKAYSVEKSYLNQFWSRKLEFGVKLSSCLVLLLYWGVEFLQHWPSILLYVQRNCWEEVGWLYYKK